MTEQCLICGCGQGDRPMCFQNEEWCSENCRKFTVGEEPIPPKCICPRFSDTGNFRIADLCCPVHGVNGTDPGDGFWDDHAVE